MSEIELKPCPFCGGEATDNTLAGGIVCRECGLRSISWNHRPIEDALNARISALESQLAEAQRKYEKVWEIGIDCNTCPLSSEPACDGICSSKANLISYCAEVKKNALIVHDAYNAHVAEMQEYVNSLQNKLAAVKRASLRFVTYDGTPETLPESEVTVIFKAVPSLEYQAGYLAIDDDYAMFWSSPANDWPLSIGDIWAYLPSVEVSE